MSLSFHRSVLPQTLHPLHLAFMFTRARLLSEYIFILLLLDTCSLTLPTYSYKSNMHFLYASDVAYIARRWPHGCALSNTYRKFQNYEPDSQACKVILKRRFELPTLPPLLTTSLVPYHRPVMYFQPNPALFQPLTTISR